MSHAASATTSHSWNPPGTMGSNFIITIAVLAWLYVRHPLRYRPIRTVLYTATILALGGFWFFALAPPRRGTLPLAVIPGPGQEEHGR